MVKEGPRKIQAGHKRCKGGIIPSQTQPKYMENNEKEQEQS